METIDTCETCGVYYITRNLDVLSEHDTMYVPQSWSSIESAFWSSPNLAEFIETGGQCYVCAEVKPLRYRFTV